MMYIIFSINSVNLNFSEGRKMVGLLGTFKFGLKIARFSCYNSLTKPMSFLYACIFLQDVWQAEAVVYLGKEFLLDLGYCFNGTTISVSYT